MLQHVTRPRLGGTHLGGIFIKWDGFLLQIAPDPRLGGKTEYILRSETAYWRDYSLSEHA